VMAPTLQKLVSAAQQATDVAASAPAADRPSALRAAAFGWRAVADALDSMAAAIDASPMPADPIERGRIDRLLPEEARREGH
jgi:hypothetical protein